MTEALRLETLTPAWPLSNGLDDGGLDRLFRTARSQNGWLDAPVTESLLREAVDLAKMAPTEANSSPLRIVFVKTEEGKARLKPALAPGNVEKTMTAPVAAIIAYDAKFYDQLPKLLPHVDARSWYAGNPKAEDTAKLNAGLEAGYFMLALRALGLDVGPIGGFDKDKVDAEFFAGTSFRSTMIVNIGHGDPAKLFPRSPRLAFDEIATLV